MKKVLALFFPHFTVLILPNEPIPGNQRVFTAEEVRGWAHDLRMVANRINHFDHKLANYFYDVHYTIGPNAELNRTNDEFALDTNYLRLMERKPDFDFVKSLRVVLENGVCVDPALWNSGLEEYLKTLLAMLEPKQPA
jgi:hypothetical protein